MSTSRLLGLALVALTGLATPAAALPMLSSWQVKDRGQKDVSSPPPKGSNTNLRYVTSSGNTIWYEDRSDADKGIELRWADNTGAWPTYDFDESGTYGDVDTSKLLQWGLHADVFATGSGLGMYYWDYWKEDQLYFAMASDGVGHAWDGETLVSFAGTSIETAGIVDVANVGGRLRLYFTNRDTTGKLGVWVAEGQTAENYTSYGAPTMILDASLSPYGAGWTPTGAVRQTSWGGWIMALVDENDTGVYLAESWDGLSSWALVNGGQPVLPGLNEYHTAMLELDLVDLAPNQWDILYNAPPTGCSKPAHSQLGVATLTVSGPVPEPTSCALLALAVGGVGAALRKRRR